MRPPTKARQFVGPSSPGIKPAWPCSSSVRVSAVSGQPPCVRYFITVPLVSKTFCGRSPLPSRRRDSTLPIGWGCPGCLPSFPTPLCWKTAVPSRHEILPKRKQTRMYWPARPQQSPAASLQPAPARRPGNRPPSRKIRVCFPCDSSLFFSQRATISAFRYYFAASSNSASANALLKLLVLS